MNRMITAAIAGALFLCPWLEADIVTLKNGDRVSGAIQQSNEKEMVMKTEFLGEVKIQWEAIDLIESEEKLYVTDRDGQVLVGPVSTQLGEIRVATADAGVAPVSKAAVTTIRNQTQQEAHEAEIERLRDPGLLDFWSGFFDTGLSFTQGNADTRTFTTSAKTARITQRDKITVYMNSIFAENNTTGDTLTTANAIRGGTRYEVNVTEKLFTFGFIDLEFDEFQDLDLRNVLGGGMGWHVKKSERMSFDVFAGGTYNQEFFANDITRRSGEIVVGEELDFRLTDRFNLSERLAFYPNLTNTGEYRLQFDSSLVSQLYKWIGWHFSLSDRFLSNPVPGRQQNDVLVSTGLRLSFGRAKLR